MSKKVERTAKRNGQRAQGLGRCRIPTYLLTSFVLSAAVILPYMSPTMLRLDVNSESSKGVYVPGPGMRPQLMFACCNQGKEALSALLADPSVFADLKELHAGLAIPIDELSPDRAQLVHRLNEAGIPASAWIVLPGEQGYYVNASNAPQTARWFAEFEKWSRENNLHWNAVGLDIEPDFREFQWSKWRLAWTLLRRGFDSERVNGPRQAYAALIHEMQVRGYRVQTCQFIFLADERKVHSTILERLFGLVDVRGDEEVLMTYTTFNHKAGAAMVWSYGQDTQALVVGSTLGSGNAAIDAKYGPLNWEEFSRDTIVASHFSRESGRVQPRRVRATRILVATENEGLEPRSRDPCCGFGENAQVSRRGARDPVDGVASTVLRDSVSNCSYLAGASADSPETRRARNVVHRLSRTFDPRVQTDKRSTNVSVPSIYIALIQCRIESASRVAQGG